MADRSRQTRKSLAAADDEVSSPHAVKETAEAILIAFVFAFVFRAYVVEAFVIPTGSMAPTLLGQHMRVRCIQCGYRFQTDVADADKGETNKGTKAAKSKIGADRHLLCPMCHYRNTLRIGTKPRAGDRILVHKYVYSLTEPNRWDVVVFKNPTDPDDNYIKRLVGLPGEKLLVVEGNVYVKPSADPDAPWRIARKTDERQNPKAELIQRAMWQPVYHSRFIPLDQGRSSPTRRAGWQCPWVVRSGAWAIEGRKSYEHESADKGVIAFDFTRQFRSPIDWYAYNQLKPQRFDPQPIEEVRIAAGVEPHESGLAVCMRTTARLDGDEPVVVTARIDAAGRATLEAHESDDPDNVRVLAQTQAHSLPPGRSTDVELWYVDQQVSLWIAGRLTLAWSFDFDDFGRVTHRPPLEAWQYPQIAIEVDGAAVTLHRVEVDRDVAYTTYQGSEATHRGTIRKYPDGHHDSQPVDILADQYFCLGDNSPMSSDGRFWKRVDPWIKRTMFNEGENAKGIVPRELMIGRAFFVYFPAPYSTRPSHWALFPNFGQMRFIH